MCNTCTIYVVFGTACRSIICMLFTTRLKGLSHFFLYSIVRLVGTIYRQVIPFLLRGAELDSFNPSLFELDRVDTSGNKRRPDVSVSLM